MLKSFPNHVYMVESYRNLTPYGVPTLQTLWGTMILRQRRLRPNCDRARGPPLPQVVSTWLQTIGKP